MARTPKTPPKNINGAPYWHTEADADKPVTYHLTVRILPREIIERLTVLSRLERFGDEAGTRPATDREMVALIRHCLINRRPNTPPVPASRYHNSVDNFRHRIALTSATAEEFTERLAEFKRLCLRLIGESYPYLKEECDRQCASIFTDTRNFDYHAARRNAP